MAVEQADVVKDTRRRLGAAGALDTWQGTLAIHLAQNIAAGGHTGAALASLSREYRAAMDGALGTAQGAADAVNELGQARRARIQGA